MPEHMTEGGVENGNFVWKIMCPQSGGLFTITEDQYHGLETIYCVCGQNILSDFSRLISR
jgi:hypothetical protein